MLKTNGNNINILKNAIQMKFVKIKNELRVNL